MLLRTVNQPFYINASQITNFASTSHIKTDPEKTYRFYLITACTVVQCSVMDDSAFLWEHAIFGPPPHRNPLTDRYEILHN
jgi:hypothetical protein